MKVNLVEGSGRTAVLVGPAAVGLLGVLVAVAVVGLVGVGIGSHAGPPIAVTGALIAGFALTLE